MRALWRQAGSGPCRCGRGLDRPLLPPSPVAMQTAGREPRLQTPSGDAHWAFSLSSTSNECTSLWVEQRPASGPCSGSSLFWRALTGPWDLAPSPPGAWALRERYGGSCPCSCGKGPPSPPPPSARARLPYVACAPGPGRRWERDGPRARQRVGTCLLLMITQLACKLAGCRPAPALAVLEHLNCHESLYEVFPNGCILGYDPAHHSPAAPVAPQLCGIFLPPVTHTWPRPSSPPLVEPGPTES